MAVPVSPVAPSVEPMSVVGVPASVPLLLLFVLSPQAAKSPLVSARASHPRVLLIIEKPP